MSEWEGEREEEEVKRGKEGIYSRYVHVVLIENLVYAYIFVLRSKERSHY